MDEKIDEKSTLEYVREGLARGQLVFRRVVLERLLAELEERDKQDRTAELLAQLQAAQNQIQALDTARREIDVHKWSQHLSTSEARRKQAETKLEQAQLVLQDIAKTCPNCRKQALKAIGELSKAASEGRAGQQL